MLKKLLKSIMVFVIVAVMLIPVSDSILTAIEAAAPLIIGAVAARECTNKILVAGDAATRIKTVIATAILTAALIAAVANFMVEVEALDWTYIKFDDMMIAMMIIAIIGASIEMVRRGMTILIRHFIAISSNK